MPLRALAPLLVGLLSLAEGVDEQALIAQAGPAMREGQAAMQGRDFRQAESAFREARAIVAGTPLEARILRFLAQALGAQGNFREEAAAWKALVKIEKQSPKPSEGMFGEAGEALKSLGDADAAAEAFEALVALATAADLSRGAASRELGMMHSKAGRMLVARDALGQAVRFNPKDQKARRAYSYILASVGEAEESFRQLGHVCMPRDCGDTAGYEIAPDMAQLVTDPARFHMQPASAELRERWQANELMVHGFRGAVPRGVMDALEYAMRTEAKYWEIEEELIRRHQHSTDSGLITYWAPTHCKQPWFGGAPDCSQRTSEPTAPTMLIEQIASEFVLPLLPKKTQEQVVGIEYWAHSKLSNRFPFAIPGHDLHYDFDTLEWEKTKNAGAGVIHYPLFTCLVYIDNGNHRGGATYVYDNSRTSDEVDPLAQRGWAVGGYEKGDVACFNATRLHGVLPGIIQPEEDHSTVARQGQERKSINIAFWPRECHHSSSLCKAKPSVAPEETTKSDDGRPSYAEEWDFESEMPLWSGDAAAAQVSPVEMKIAQVDRIWRRIGEEQEPQAGAVDEAALGAELRGMRLAALHKRAVKEGVGPDAIDAAMDADDAKGALVALIVQALVD